jgi:hypothetical protein
VRYHFVSRATPLKRGSVGLRRKLNLFGFGTLQRSHAGPRFYLALLLFLAVVYLAVWVWVLAVAPDAWPIFRSYLLNVGLPLLAAGVAGLLFWIWLEQRP